jgi:hypothetical protein
LHRPWLPFDYTATVLLEITGFVMVIHAFYQGLLIFASVTIMFATGVLIWAQIKVLNSKLRSIRPENIITDVVPDEPGVNRIIHVNPLVGIMVDEETDVKVKPARTVEPVTSENTSKVHGEDDKSASDVVRRRRQQILMEQKKREEDIKMESKLMECVKLHQALLRCGSDIISECD